MDLKGNFHGVWKGCEGADVFVGFVSQINEKALRIDIDHLCHTVAFLRGGGVQEGADVHPERCHLQVLQVFTLRCWYEMSIKTDKKGGFSVGEHFPGERSTQSDAVNERLSGNKTAFLAPRSPSQGEVMTAGKKDILSAHVPHIGKWKGKNKSGGRNPAACSSKRSKSRHVRIVFERKFFTEIVDNFIADELVKKGVVFSASQIFVGAQAGLFGQEDAGSVLQGAHGDVSLGGGVKNSHHTIHDEDFPWILWSFRLCAPFDPPHVLGVAL